jgi:hypothetical protein
MWPFYLAQVPSSPDVEPASVAAGSSPRLGTPAAPFANDAHGGSPNLGEWPPSNEEMAAAMAVVGGDDSAIASLIALAQSPERYRALKHYADVVLAAQAVIERVTGSGT